MKQKHFYSHLIPHDFVSQELDKLGVSHEEKINLLVLFHANLHLVILDITLTNLTTSDKHTVLEHIEKQDHAKTWEFLKAKKPGIEKQVVDAIKKHIDEFKKDLEQAKNA